MNKKSYMAILSCAVLTAAIGIAGKTGENKPKSSDNVEEKQVEMVDVNKNYGGVNYNSTKENGSVQQYYKPEVKVQKKTEEKKEVPAKKADADEKTVEVFYEDEEFVLNDSAEPVFMWPVEGEIVMDYSVESLVYDPTLEQYRTNDSICISAPKGKNVLCAADGTVESVENDYENGYTVTVYHGEGWRTTYSQLDKDLAVEQGDILKVGEKIGVIADPTKYSVAMGHHLEFAMTENNESIDPKEVLKN